jgi:hypothetical protein
MLAEKESVSTRREAAEDLYRAEFGDSPADHAAPEKPVIQVGPLTGLSWSEAIARVLRDAGQPLHVKEIWQRLQAGGFRTDSRDPVRSVVAIAVRDPASFPRAGPNRYGLEGARAEAPEGGEAKA